MFLNQLIGAVSTALSNNVITVDYKLVSAKDISGSGSKEFSFSDGVSIITIYEDSSMLGVIKTYGSMLQFDNLNDVLQVIGDFTVQTVQGE